MADAGHGARRTLPIAAVLSAVTLALGGCAVNDAPPKSPPPPPLPEPSAECTADPAQSLIGQPATAELGAQALSLTGSKTLRWIQPGTAVTMDFRPDRLNIELDEKNAVKAIRCG